MRVGANYHEEHFYKVLDMISLGETPTSIPMWYTIKHLLNDPNLQSPSLDILKTRYRQPSRQHRVYTK